MPPHHLDAVTVLGWWTYDPLVTAVLAVSGVLYARGARALARRADGLPALRRWEVAAFAAGWLALFVALVSPLDALSDLLFSAHMAQHELLMVVAAPLLVLGRPLVAMLWALPARARARVGALVRQAAWRRAWHSVSGPLAALLVHGVAVWVWHVPSWYEAALRNEGVHLVQHLCFFWTAALFWWAVVHGRYGRIGYGVAVLFVFATAVHTSVLGALLTFATRLWYPLYGERGRAWGIVPLEDQQLAGLIMWVPAGALLMVIGLALFAAWLGESERRLGYTRVATLTVPARRGPDEG
jgi:cytochrome c oxidase assembly factor CtaG